MPNALAQETSPYLRQHAENPVDWLPWGPEALAAARARDVPLVVSIGYSACHWCHVMEHESFEDPGVAALMNEEFVCVKVDREERPDVDALYMEAVQGMTGHGGWPLNVFLTPEQTPFYGGTYFPPEPRHGMPSWTQVLQAIAETWRENAAEIRAGGERIREQLSRGALMEPSAEPFDTGALDAAVARLRETFDAVHGGFGGPRSSRRLPPWSSCCWPVRGCERSECLPNLSASTRCRSRRCARWRAGASTTSSAGAFTATRWTPPGRCRTSRRCSTTTRCSRAPTCMVIGSATTRGSPVSAARRSTGPCARCVGPRAGSTPRSTPTPRAWRAASTCGRVGELEELLGEDADAAIGWLGVTERGNFVDPHHPEPGLNVLTDRSSTARGPTRQPASASARGCSGPARAARGRASTTSA